MSKRDGTGASPMLTRRTLLGTTAAGLLLPDRLFAAPGDPWTQAAAIEARVRPPRFPDRAFDVNRYGAKPDGRTLNSQAFADAIAACVAAGGGRVHVPAGRYLTGPIRLRSNVELHVAEGATLLFATDPKLYPIVHTRWEGMELMNYSPLVYAYRERNVAVTGGGTLDGQGSNEHWWPWCGAEHYGWKPGMPSQRAARDKVIAMMEAGVPPEKRLFGQGSYLRPPMFQPYECRNVLIEGVRIRNSPFWNINPVLCRNVIARGVDVFGHGPNNDGCDPESVDTMLIEKCVFDTGDDCIAIKSGRNADGRRLAAPAQNILIRDCDMKDGHGGVTIGSEISGDCRWVFAENNRMDSPNLWYAFRFKNNAMRGGVLEHFYLRDTKVGQVGRAAITCDFNYEEGALGPYHPVLRDVVIERMEVSKALQVLDLQGLLGDPVQDVTIRDSRFDGVTRPSVIRYSERLRIEAVTVNGHAVTQL